MLSDSNLIDPVRVNSLLKDSNTVVIDLSTPEQFDEVHIAAKHPGQVRSAHFLYKYDLLEDEGGYPALLEMMSNALLDLGIWHDSNVIFTEHDFGSSPGSSFWAEFLFRVVGFPEDQLFILNGGNLAWQAMGAQVESGPVVGSPSMAVIPMSLRKDLCVNRGRIISHRYTPTAKLVDARSVEEFVGLIASPPGYDPSLPSGRLPGGAMNMGHDSCYYINRGVCFLHTPESLARLFSGMPISRNDEIIVYCYKGVRAAVIFKVLKDILGFKDVKIYVEGWGGFSSSSANRMAENETPDSLADRTFGMNQMFASALENRARRKRAEEAQ